MKTLVKKFPKCLGELRVKENYVWCLFIIIIFIVIIFTRSEEVGRGWFKVIIWGGQATKEGTKFYGKEGVKPSGHNKESFHVP